MLSPGDKFEIHPGEADSDLASVSDVSDYSIRIKTVGTSAEEEETGNEETDQAGAIAPSPGDFL